MNSDIWLERLKRLGFVVVSTIGWLVCCVLALQLFCISMLVNWFVVSVIEEFARMLGATWVTAYLCGGYAASLSFIVTGILNAAKIRKPVWMELANPKNFPTYILRLVWWGMASPNRLTFIVGCIIPPLIALDWLSTLLPSAQDSTLTQPGFESLSVPTYTPGATPLPHTLNDAG